MEWMCPVGSDDVAHVPACECITDLVRGPEIVRDLRCAQQEITPLLLAGSALSARVVAGEAPPTGATVPVRSTAHPRILVVRATLTRRGSTWLRHSEQTTPCSVHELPLEGCEA